MRRWGICHKGWQWPVDGPGDVFPAVIADILGAETQIEEPHLLYKVGGYILTEVPSSVLTLSAGDALVDALHIYKLDGLEKAVADLPEAVANHHGAALFEGVEIEPVNLLTGCCDGPSANVIDLRAHY